MNFSPGEIYFIQEYDPQTGRATKYVKIGLVRNGRTTAQRIKEHQTGNPRALKETKLFQTPAVHFVENSLHQLFAESRITGGEWFIFTETQLRDCIETAKNLVADVKKQESIFAAALAFKTKRSKKAVIVPTKPVLALHKDYFRSDFIIQQLKTIVEKYERQLDEQAASGEDVDDLRSLKVVQTSRFDEAGFRAAMPGVYKKFLVSELKIEGRFTVLSKDDHQFSLSLLDPKLADFIAGFSNTIEQLKKNPKVLDVAKAKYSYIKGQVAIAEWNKAKVENQIRLACANNAGIEGVCRWVRLPKEKTVFDRAALKRERPDVFEKFSKKQTTTRRSTKSGRTSAGAKPRK